MKFGFQAAFLLGVLGFVNSIASAQTISTYAGPQLAISGSAATTQGIDNPEGIALDGAGGFYVSSFTENRVYHVTAAGALVLVAGTGTQGFSGDGGPATAAQLSSPTRGRRNGQPVHRG